MKGLISAIAAGLAFAMIPPATAQDDIANRIINDPGSPQVMGVTPKLREDSAVQGGQALRIEVKNKGANPWDVAVQTAINKPVKAGDTILLAFWARLEKGDGGSADTTLPYNAVQLSSAPYTALFTGPVTIGKEWKMYEVQGKAARDQPAGTLNASIHLAAAAQTVDLGPIFVLNMGQ